MGGSTQTAVTGASIMLKIGAIVWGVPDIPRGVAFWSEALNYELRYPLRMKPSPDFAILVPKDGEGVQFSLNKVTSDKPKRHHLDLFTEDQAAEVERLLKLGATRVDWNYEPDADYIVLADPDGNPFCVIQV
jgi:catechol 2,3-dioxygenase-like lactoylglutathione lyase family enzyme